MILDLSAAVIAGHFHHVWVDYVRRAAVTCTTSGWLQLVRRIAQRLLELDATFQSAETST